ncbi:hypothetical protein AAUPMC_11122, partial [Pasteurella multocida subsp. multocida str. Anand1_cattle]
LDRTFAHFELHQPLRWQVDDKLEAFMDDLLLLHAEDLPFAPLASAEGVQFQRYSQHTLYQATKNCSALWFTDACPLPYVTYWIYAVCLMRQINYFY